MPREPDDEPIPDAPADAESVEADEDDAGGMEPLPVRGTARPAPAAARAPADPFAKAQEALARAAAARGAELTPIPASRRHPLEAAQDALAKAREAREHAAAGGSRGLAREADARAQLDQLKRTGGRAPAASDASDDAPPPDAPATPKKRRL